jgi:hypothetical protein
VGYELSHTHLKKHFLAMLMDPCMDVVQLVLGHLETVLELLAANASSEQTRAFVREYFDKQIALHAQIKAKSWRTEALYLNKLPCVFPLATHSDMCTIVLPILRTTLQTSPRQCKNVGCDLLTQLLNGYCKPPIRTEIHGLAKALALSSNCHDRVTFLEFVHQLTNRMSKHYFKEHFLTLTLALGDDKVLDVLLKFCGVACAVKKNLLAEDIATSDRVCSVVEALKSKSRCKSLQQVRRSPRVGRRKHARGAQARLTHRSGPRRRRGSSHRSRARDPQN